MRPLKTTLYTYPDKINDNDCIKLLLEISMYIEHNVNPYLVAVMHK